MARHLRKEVKRLMGCEDPGRDGFVPATELRDLLIDKAKPVLEKIREERIASKGESGVPSLTNLNDFVIDRACKIFGILLIRGKHKRIITFCIDNFGDDMLPVRTKIVHLEDDDVFGTIESCNRTQADGSGVVLRDRWDDVEAEDFPENQWPFLAQVFERDTFRYTIEDQECLPLTKRSKRLNDDNDRNYSWVDEWSVHKDYVTFMEPEDACFDDQGNPRVAIKQLKPTARDMTSVADREAKGLELMRDADHDHLMKAIAYYQHKGGHFFLFPWAEQGNLWEFWTKTENAPIHDGPYLTWVFARLTGLAQGIEKLHHPPSSQTRSDNSDSESEGNNDHSYSSEDNSCRHGDLKPENILCFKAKAQDRIRGNGVPNIRLVITDVGLAKTHNKATQFRPSTNTIVSTKRYLAPEMEVNPKGRLGRRFDIWSMGCLFLEFTIWLLYGADELDRCTANISEFFETYETSETETEIESDKYLKPPTQTFTKKKWARRHPVVDGWIEYLKKDWRCSEGTALGKLVELMDKWMLVVKVEELEAPPTLQRQTTSLEKGTSDVAQPADYSRKPGYRTYAPAMVKDLEEILTDLQESRIKAIGTKPHAGADTPKGPSNVTSTTEGGTPSVVVAKPV